MDGDGGSGGGPPGVASGEVGSLSLPTALSSLTFWLKDWEEGRRENEATAGSALTLRGNAVVLRKKNADHPSQSEL